MLIYRYTFELYTTICLFVDTTLSSSHSEYISSSQLQRDSATVEEVRQLLHHPPPPPRRGPATQINCARLYSGDEDEIARATDVQNVSFRSLLRERVELQLPPTCDSFAERRGYYHQMSTKEEQEFPLAFAIALYKDPWQVEALLRAIYRPHNVYCLHVDVKANQSTYDAMVGLARCLPNVFLSSRRADVRWGQFSLLETNLICMEDLLRYSGKWKYFLNLAGQEWPLKTNRELVQILKALNGANAIAGTLR